MDKEFLQYIKDMRYDDLASISEKNVLRYKSTLGYQWWLLGKATRELGNVIIKVLRDEIEYLKRR